MIVYHKQKRDFLADLHGHDIEHLILAAMKRRVGHGVSQAEIKSWKESLTAIGKVLYDPTIPEDAGVAVEYAIPQTAKRIDVIVSGRDDEGRDSAVVVELKQWSWARKTDKDAIVVTHLGKGEREVSHPSYQAWTYVSLLNAFNEAVHSGGIALQPCAYLHNYVRDGQLDDPFYETHLQEAPLFFSGEPDRQALRGFIRERVCTGDRGETIARIEHGRIRPSKMLADSIAGMLDGNREFVLIDDQKVVYEQALALAAKAQQGGPKQVLIVEGGPGTGKTVLAINLLAELTKRRIGARYVSKNAAPREVYQRRLAGTRPAKTIKALFSGSGAYVAVKPDAWGTLIVDEAHRLNEKSGLYGVNGEHQAKEAIRASRSTVFFVDDDQRVTLKDIGERAALRQWAIAEGAEVTEAALESQFRCNGSDGYLQWLDDALGIRETAHPKLAPREFDFRVFDDPAQLHAVIERRNRGNNRSRVVAGYCWTWPSKRDAAAWDIEMPAFGYRRRWNLDKDGSLWIVTPGSVDEVGCIHTCQGLELDVVGVIIGPDLAFRDGRVVVDASKRASSDQSVRGLRQMARDKPAEAAALAERIVKNTYRTLMSRGMQGCYVYCADAALAEHLRSRLAPPAAPGAPPPAPEPALPLRRVSDAERQAGVPAAPLVSLRFAAGAFGEGQALDDGAEAWVALPDWVAPAPGLFVAQVEGESMNRRIPNGSWNLFRAAPAGTREGKIVVVQHRDIADPDTGGRYTIKRYRSEKVADEAGGWRHTRIVLQPESDEPGYAPLVLELGPEQDTVQVVAEWLMTLPPDGDG